MRKVLLFISPILFLISCSDGGGGSDSNTDNQMSNRTSLLENVTNNIIIPSYNNLIDDINNLSVTTTSFTSNPTQQNLDRVRKAWVKTYVTWQKVEMFNINMAEEMEYYKTMNTYPVHLVILKIILLTDPTTSPQLLTKVENLKVYQL